MPFFQTFSADSSHPGTRSPPNSLRRCSISQPASSSAPRVMSPLMPEKQSKYASFMGVRHNRGKPRGGYACPQENVSDGSISILSAGGGGGAIWSVFSLKQSGGGKARVPVSSIPNFDPTFRSLYTVVP